MEGEAGLPATGEKKFHQTGTLIGQDTGCNSGLRVKKMR